MSNELDELLNKMLNCAVFLGEPGDQVSRMLIAMLKRCREQRNSKLYMDAQWEAGRGQLADDAELLAISRGEK